MQLGGNRTGTRVVICEELELDGLTDPFDFEVIFGERIAVLGPNGTGKSHFLRLLAGEPVEHSGAWRLGARVVPGYFRQTHDQPELREVAVLDAVMKAGLRPGQGDGDAAPLRAARRARPSRSRRCRAASRRACRSCCSSCPGANLLLLDEPTDNLDLASAEALEEALDSFFGTVVAVTHDRWFLRRFDRFLDLRPGLLGPRAPRARLRLSSLGPAPKPGGCSTLRRRVGQTARRPGRGDQ